MNEQPMAFNGLVMGDHNRWRGITRTISPPDVVVEAPDVVTIEATAFIAVGGTATSVADSGGGATGGTALSESQTADNVLEAEDSMTILTPSNIGLKIGRRYAILGRVRLLNGTTPADGDPGWNLSVIIGSPDDLLLGGSAVPGDAEPGDAMPLSLGEASGGDAVILQRRYVWENTYELKLIGYWTFSELAEQIHVRAWADTGYDGTSRLYLDQLLFDERTVLDAIEVRDLGSESTVVTDTATQGEDSLQQVSVATAVDFDADSRILGPVDVTATSDPGPGTYRVYLRARGSSGSVDITWRAKINDEWVGSETVFTPGIRYKLSEHAGGPFRIDSGSSVEVWAVASTGSARLDDLHFVPEAFIDLTPPKTPQILSCPAGALATSQLVLDFAESVEGDPGWDQGIVYDYLLDDQPMQTVLGTPVIVSGLAIGAHQVTVWARRLDSGVMSDPSVCRFSVAAPGSVAFPVVDLPYGILNEDDWWVRVDGVDGLWGADARESRTSRPGRPGSIPGRQLDDGMVVALRATVQGRTVSALRRGQRAVRRAFDGEHHNLYFRTWIDQQPLLIVARRNQKLVMPESQDTRKYERSFTVNLASPMASALSVVEQAREIDLSQIAAIGRLRSRDYPIQRADGLRYRSYDLPGVQRRRRYSVTAGTFRVTNLGQVATWPIVELYGPISGPLTLGNLSTGEQLVWDSDLVLGQGEYLIVSMLEPSIQRNQNPDPAFVGLDVAGSDFWSLRPGDNVIAVLPFSSQSGARAILRWRDAPQ